MRKYWVVVVDDDPASLKTARSLLNTDKMKISLLRSGRELLQFVEHNDPDLILLDILMPEMDGFETFHRLREYEDLEGKRNIPVIFLTGEDDGDMEQIGLRIGAADFIRKPVLQEILIRRIQNSISNSLIIENLTEEATKDKLTGFYNKATTASKMSEICKEGSGMLMVLDLDDFKLVNDLYGHEMGDSVLKAFAVVARNNCRTDDILCRIGGDEFLAFFRNTVDENIAASFTHRINGQLMESCIKLMGDDFNIPIGVSVGCVPVEEGGDYNELFRLADKALYQVKRSGKHGCQFYDAGLMHEDKRELDVDKELNRMMVLCSERGRLENAMMVGQDSFIPVYRYVERFTRRYRKALTKLMFTLLADESVDGEECMEAVSVFGSILQNTLRRNDVITKNKPNCYFLLLPELSGEETEDVVGRIIRKWEQTDYSKMIRVSYAMESSDFLD